MWVYEHWFRIWLVAYSEPITWINADSRPCDNRAQMHIVVSLASAERYRKTLITRMAADTLVLIEQVALVAATLHNLITNLSFCRLGATHLTIKSIHCYLVSNCVNVTRKMSSKIVVSSMAARWRVRHSIVINLAYVRQVTCSAFHSYQSHLCPPGDVSVIP